MQWVEGLNQAINYIEQHLTEELDHDQLGRMACCSSYHFQRMFTYMAGIPLSEYVRRRKMSLAAVDLQNGAKIVDVALKYGYNSPTAFNRAFQAVHGIAPSRLHSDGVQVKSYPPILFKLVIKGAEEMNYRIEKKEAISIVGLSTPMEREIEKNFAAVPLLWEKAAADGTLGKLAGLMDTEPKGILGVCACTPREEWRYYIAAASTLAPEGLETYQIPAFTWAIFPGEGPCPQAIQQLEQRIVTEWLPTSGYEYADGPDVELYLSPNTAQGKFEVWIPVTPKKQKE